MNKPKNKFRQVFSLIFRPITIALIGATIGFFLSPAVLVPNINSVYTSDVIIEQSTPDYACVIWEYHIQPEKKFIWDSPKESWAYFDLDIKNIENDFDLSDYEGISFIIKGNIESQLIEFNLFTHNLTNVEHKVYQYGNKEKLLVTTNWRREIVFFSNLDIVPWTKYVYPEAPESPSLENVYAFGFAVKTYNPVKNNIWIDRICLVNKNENKSLIEKSNTLNVTINGKEGAWHAGWGHK